MTALVRLVRCELKKMRHTLLWAMHIFLPLLGALVFLLYYKGSAWPPAAQVDAYFQTITIVFPFLVSMVCPMSVQLEEDGRLQTFFMTAVNKQNAFGAKWLALFLGGLFSVILAVGAFAVGYHVFIGQVPGRAEMYVEAVLIIWAGQGVLYLIHLFLSFQFGKGVSIGVGTAGTVLAALMLTGLGEDCWQFVPYGWSGRFYSSLVSQSIPDRKLYVICGIIIILILGVIYAWFRIFEGRKCQE